MPRADMTAEKTPDNYMESQNATRRADDGETEIDLVELLFQWIQHSRFILLLVIAGALLSASYTYFIITPKYVATSKLYVLNSGDSALNLSDLQIGSYLTSDYIEVFKTWEVHELVMTNLGLSYSYSQMQRMLTIENPTGTRILYITVESPNAREAAAIANEYASVAIKYIADTMSTEEPNIMSTALEPTNPSSPNKTQNILIGLILGLLISVGWVTLKYIMDDKIKSVDDIRKYTNLPVLAVVPTFAAASAKNNQKSKRKQV